MHLSHSQEAVWRSESRLAISLKADCPEADIPSVQVRAPQRGVPSISAGKPPSRGAAPRRSAVDTEQGLSDALTEALQSRRTTVIGVAHLFLSQRHTGRLRGAALHRGQRHGRRYRDSRRLLLRRSARRKIRDHGDDRGGGEDPCRAGASPSENECRGGWKRRSRLPDWHFLAKWTRLDLRLPAQGIERLG
jgi:hypothetical protein